MDLVLLHNDFNNVSLTALKEKELDILMSVCYKLRDEGTKEVQLSFAELKELSQYHSKNLDRFVKDVEGVFNKFLKLRFRYEDEKRIVNFVLFTRTEILKDERYVSIRVNEEFKYILNELTGNFTKFELSQFVKLNSHYSKNLFRLLKQFSSTGWREFLLSDFRNLLDIPEKYRISEIDKYVLNEKNIKELSESFTNLKIIKKYNGRLVHKIKFEWEIVTVLPQQKTKSIKKEKTLKEKNTEIIIKKQEEEIELGEIINRKINDFFDEINILPFEIQTILNNRAYSKFLKDSNSSDNKTMQGIFEKSKKAFIVEEYKKYIEEQESTPEKYNIVDLSKEEKKLILNYRKLQLKSETMTDMEKFDNFRINELIDSRYNDKHGLDNYFTDKDLMNEFTPKGLEFAELYIKNNNLEKLILSKTGKELRGLAKINKMIKVFKEHYILSHL